MRNVILFFCLPLIFLGTITGFALSSAIEATLMERVGVLEKEMEACCSTPTIYGSDIAQNAAELAYLSRLRAKNDELELELEELRLTFDGLKAELMELRLRFDYHELGQ